MIYITGDTHNTIDMSNLSSKNIRLCCIIGEEYFENKQIGVNMKKLLWLDDFRNPTDYVTGDYDIYWVRNYTEFCKFIVENGLPDIICFDHDLGEEKSGYDCAKFVVNYCQEHNLDIPSYDIQSSNNVGKDNIRSLMNNWHRVFLDRNGEKKIE